jgi:hypothetical protein
VRYFDSIVGFMAYLAALRDREDAYIAPSHQLAVGGVRGHLISLDNFSLNIVWGAHVDRLPSIRLRSVDAESTRNGSARVVYKMFEGLLTQWLVVGREAYIVDGTLVARQLLQQFACASFPNDN